MRTATEIKDVLRYYEGCLMNCHPDCILEMRARIEVLRWVLGSDIDKLLEVEFADLQAKAEKELQYLKDNGQFGLPDSEIVLWENVLSMLAMVRPGIENMGIRED